MRRLGSLLIFTVLMAAGCQQAALPVWYVPADPGLSAAEVEARTSSVLAGLGYEMESFDPELQMLQTRWRHEGQLISSRYQVLLRLKRSSPFAVAVTVPREAYDGMNWIPNGEQEQRRKELVAGLTAQLAPRAQPKP